MSIHVLREEDDGMVYRGSVRFKISIHVLREEDDLLAFSKSRSPQTKFLSTSSARRTTI